MKSRVNTLLLYAPNVPNTKRIVTDTLREELHIELEKMPQLLQRNWLIHNVFKQGYRSLSYVLDWQEAFLESPRLRIDACNINNLFRLIRYMRNIQHYEMIIILHSAAGDHMRTLLWNRYFFQKRKGRLVVCFGNEYSLMPEKISFAQSVGADFIVTQLPIEGARWLYSDCRASKLIAAPAALNPHLYHATPNPRPFDIGFRGSFYSYAIGDNQRSQFIAKLKEMGNSWGLNCNIQYKLLERDLWSDFLSRCYGIPGAESGTYYLEKDDHTQKAIARYLRRNPKARFETIAELFFRKYSGAVSGKAISSRHFEPIGTQTCQLLLEGEYNGILKPEEHYICVKKDLSNIQEAIRKFKDDDYRQSIVKKSYEFVMSLHTYQHRVESILATVLD